MDDEGNKSTRGGFVKYELLGDPLPQELCAISSCGTITFDVLSVLGIAGTTFCAMATVTGLDPALCWNEKG